MADLIGKKVKELIKSRQKRDTATAGVTVDIIDGYPEVDRKSKTATYVVSVSDGMWASI